EMHVFVYLSPGEAVVVPGRAFESERAFDDFQETARRYYKAAGRQGAGGGRDLGRCRRRSARQASRRSGRCPGPKTRSTSRASRKPTRWIARRALPRRTGVVRQHPPGGPRRRSLVLTRPRKQRQRGTCPCCRREERR